MIKRILVNKYTRLILLSLSVFNTFFYRVSISNDGYIYVIAYFAGYGLAQIPISYILDNLVSPLLLISIQSFFSFIFITGVHSSNFLLQKLIFISLFGFISSISLLTCLKIYEEKNKDNFRYSVPLYIGLSFSIFCYILGSKTMYIYIFLKKYCKIFNLMVGVVFMYNYIIYFFSKDKYRSITLREYFNSGELKYVKIYDDIKILNNKTLVFLCLYVMFTSCLLFIYYHTTILEFLYNKNIKLSYRLKHNTIYLISILLSFYFHSLIKMEKDNIYKWLNFITIVDIILIILIRFVDMNLSTKYIFISFAILFKNLQVLFIYDVAMLLGKKNKTMRAAFVNSLSVLCSPAGSLIIYILKPFLLFWVTFSLEDVDLFFCVIFNLLSIFIYYRLIIK